MGIPSSQMYIKEYVLKRNSIIKLYVLHYSYIIYCHDYLYGTFVTLLFSFKSCMFILIGADR